MSESTITEASLKAALTERLNAVHVEVTDMSGTSISTYLPQALYLHP